MSVISIQLVRSLVRERERVARNYHHDIFHDSTFGCDGDLVGVQVKTQN